MTWPAEAPLMSPPQRLRAGLLRGCLRLLFRGLVRPPMPVALQRGVLRGLSLATLGASAAASPACPASGCGRAGWRRGAGCSTCTAAPT